RQTPDKKGSRWVPSVPLGLAAAASPAPRRCRQAVVVVRPDSTRSDSFCLLLDFEIDEVPIHGELADQRIDLAQEHVRMWPTFELTAHESVFVNSDVDSGSTGIFDGRRSVFLYQGKHTQDAADACFFLPLINQLA